MNEFERLSNEFKQLSDKVYEQIKDFNHEELTEEQKSLIDKLIPNAYLKECFKMYGLCNECKQPNNSLFGCQLCNPKRFQRNFKNWSSGNNVVDKFIRKVQLKATICTEVLEWIEHDRFENIEYVAEGGFGTVYKAIWKDGPIYKWDSENNQWKRGFNSFDPESEEWKIVGEKTPVALKCLHDYSQDTKPEFLREVRFFFYNF